MTGNFQWSGETKRNKNHGGIFLSHTTDLRNNPSRLKQMMSNPVEHASTRLLPRSPPMSGGLAILYPSLNFSQATPHCVFSYAL